MLDLNDDARSEIGAVALTLGIVAVVMGSVGLTVSWVPFLGLTAAVPTLVESAVDAVMASLLQSVDDALATVVDAAVKAIDAAFERAAEGGQ